MLSRSGVAVALGSLAAVVAGRVFGIYELFLVGAAGATLVVGALVLVARARLDLDISRDLQPPRVHAGSPARVDLRVDNRGPRRTPLLTLRDPVGTRGNARVILAPLGPEEQVRAAYGLPTERRGILAVGPLSVEVSDPFGLASVSTAAAPMVELTVWPAIEEVVPIPHTQGDDPHGGADHPNALATGGDDFYALRPYVAGDDLRRVHWRSTARRDQLMVRQDELPWQGRATVLLDTRRASHHHGTFERAVSACASVVVASSRRRFLLRLVTTTGLDTGFAAGTSHVEAILEHLATVGLVDGNQLAAVLGTLRRGGSAGAFAAFLGGRAKADFEAVAGLSPAYGRVVTVAFASGRDRRPSPSGDLVLVDDTVAFGPAWDAAVRRRPGVRAGVHS